MELVDVTIKVPKESKEVIDVVGSIVKEFLSGKKLPLILMENSDEIIRAISGIQKLPVELISQNQSEIMAYLVDTVGDAVGR